MRAILVPSEISVASRLAIGTACLNRRLIGVPCLFGSHLGRLGLLVAPDGASPAKPLPIDVFRHLE